jgi:Primase C terminal 2 (PriCT-2)
MVDPIDLRKDLDAKAIGKDQRKRKRAPRIKDDEDRIDRALIEAALEVIPADDYYPWIEVGAALHYEFGEDGYELFVNWSAKSDKFNAEHCLLKWENGCTRLTKYSGRTILFYADKASPNWRDAHERKIWDQFRTMMLQQHG